MRIVLLSGIFPPDIGGPATHCHDLRATLLARGRSVTVVTLHDGARTEASDGIVRFPRRWPWPVRFAAVSAWLVANRRRYEVAYATGLSEPAALGARIAGRPLVVKVVGDQAWERARRLGLVADDFEEFQARGRVELGRTRAMRWLRDRALLSASAIVAPSEYLAGLTQRWLDGRRHVAVIPNGVRCPIEALSRTREAGTLRVAFVGRLVAHKQVDRILHAVRLVPGVTLDIVGDGPEYMDLRRLADESGLRGRVHLHGERPHEEVLSLLASSDALVLASDYEGLPHVVVEALAVGTPVVAPVVGGVTEVVAHENNGLVLSSVTASNIASALSRLRNDVALRERLAAGARRSGSAWRFEAIADRVESMLDSLVRRGLRRDRDVVASAAAGEMPL